ncbi:MAG: YvcK family protein [Dictyoglomus sp.]|nr:YvcK family protein [Dictyoglomus sp.]MCX7941920.1 YvcK family protein [Dictyoglomaceae bacterium]MDW8188611.1 YvcK family protein [Dictyoglomus sp.]
MKRKSPVVTVIGGGTGLSTILRGLKKYPLRLNAIVTVSDDGGSSGRLSKDLDVLPPGDIRNCLVALADEEALMTKLFQYRFNNGDLKGHSFGNIFLVAMSSILGDFLLGIKEASKVLAIKGQVFPSTLCKVKLKAIFDNGVEVIGETAISSYKEGRIKRLSLVSSSPITATPEAVEALENSDLIIIGPGSLFTSILPNLLIDEIKNTIRNLKIPRIYICNVMTQPYETSGFSASNHLSAIVEHLGFVPVDYVIVNTKVPKKELLEKYRKSGADIVKVDLDNLKNFNVKVLSGNFISETDLVRHDADKLAKFILTKFVK